MGIEAPLPAAIAFFGALIFGITGFGSALVTIPLATHLVPLAFALPLFAVADLFCGSSRISSAPSASAWRTRRTPCAPNGAAWCR